MVIFTQSVISRVCQSFLACPLVSLFTACLSLSSNYLSKCWQFRQQVMVTTLHTRLSDCFCQVDARVMLGEYHVTTRHPHRSPSHRWDTWLAYVGESGSYRCVISNLQTTGDDWRHVDNVENAGSLMLQTAGTVTDMDCSQQIVFSSCIIKGKLDEYLYNILISVKLC